MGCDISKRARPEPTPSLDDRTALASDTPFSVSEIESLRKLFQKLSDSVIKDRLIHKAELQLALLKSVNERNFFLDRGHDTSSIS